MTTTYCPACDTTHGQSDACIRWDAGMKLHPIGTPVWFLYRSSVQPGTVHGIGKRGKYQVLHHRFVIDVDDSDMVPQTEAGRDELRAMIERCIWSLECQLERLEEL